MLSIDELDVELLKLLERDARQGVASLSTTLGISRNTVQSRIRRLEEGGLIAGYRPQIDLAQAGLVVQAFLALETEQGSLTRIAREVTEIPQVIEVHTVTGREDLLVRVATATQPELLELIETIVGYPGVIHSTTWLTLTEPLPRRAVPALAELAKGTGWGRSTPPRAGGGG
ncbi:MULTISPECIES: Lrp/AsnC family transcriptional regulator [Gordonia]|uniref:Lrp/AsnC family transcriptional regulator n=2 Tax=Gordonia TaxID=2053 RepID=A0ABN3H526_9ACTN|nr:MULTISPECIES: Lrp/AsnC family transcriptional regulator [Gordonia]AUH67690.1 Lrp/AsnC family transcriptional regulator [Gordonia sp. YC-JH1]KJR06436.1 AsnC family transcriptional regulator [Gordonia sihwensis]KXT57318.1 AsnC family transcriptional regulator [Gordonia sp. QH-12]MBY4568813.1 AsnC family transcriptional regulator [Gordonia sihwensis]GAC62018.1 putative AsnC family transcriptional regulator [Gordonia sihwensis NBRC 108236]